MQEFVQQLVNGLTWGAIYALIAVGYTMVYGVLRLINFAHGDIYMVGAMTGVYAASWLRLSGHASWPAFFVLLLSAMVVCALLGLVIERVAYRPLRDQPRINSLITAIGVSMFLQFGGQQLFGATPKAFPAEILPAIFPGTAQAPVAMGKHVLFTGEQVVIGHVSITGIDTIILLVTLVLMTSLWLVVMKTRTGMALRAVSFRFDTASLMGISTGKIISITFMLGSALAAVAGILVAFRAPKVEPLMGMLVGMKAFVAAVLGGIGNIPGAVLGGLVLGMTEVMVAGYFPQGSQWRDGVAFVILIGVLLVKPSGLLGKNVVEKV